MHDYPEGNGGTWIWAVLSNVEWSEPWILGLLFFHLSTFLVILWTRRWLLAQAALLVVLASMCLATEHINEWAATNYRSFSQHQYFDSQGLFLSLLLSLPIILNCTVMVVCWFRQVWCLLVGVALLKEQRKAKQQAKGKMD